jgi:hypothetical protein
MYEVKWKALAEHETTWKTEGLVNLCYSIMVKKVIEYANNAAEDTCKNCGQLSNVFWHITHADCQF